MFVVIYWLVDEDEYGMEGEGVCIKNLLSICVLFRM